jgi:hypothetical protein
MLPYEHEEGSQIAAKLGSRDGEHMFSDPVKVEYKVEYVVRADSSQPAGEQNLARTMSISSKDLAHGSGKAFERNQARWQADGESVRHSPEDEG